MPHGEIGRSAVECCVTEICRKTNGEAIPNKAYDAGEEAAYDDNEDDYRLMRIVKPESGSKLFIPFRKFLRK